MSCRTTNDELQTVSIHSGQIYVFSFTKYLSDNELSPGWKSFIHPSGLMYFFHETKVYAYTLGRQQNVSLLMFRESSLIHGSWILLIWPISITRMTSYLLDYSISYARELSLVVLTSNSC